MAERRDDGTPPIPDLGIPDLELAPRPRPAPGPARPVAPAPAARPAPPGPQEYFDAGSSEAEHTQSPMDYFGTTKFDDDDFDLDGRLEVGVEAGGFAIATATEQAPDAAPWPTGTSPDPEHVRVDAVEVDLLADYGKPPGAFYLAPLYALRVFQRSRALAPLLRQVAAQLDQAEQRREQLLAEVVQAHWDAIDRNERLQKLLEPVKQIDELARERHGALASTNAEYAAQVAPLDQQLAALDTERLRLETAAGDCEKVLAERQELFKRADVRQKRVLIELRSARDVAAQATPPGGAPPAEHAAHMAALAQKAQAMQPEVDRLAQDLEVARVDHAAAKSRVADVTRGIRQLQAQRRTLDEHFRKQLDARHHGVSEAAAEREKALADAGRAALATRAVALSEAELERIRTADAQVEALVKENVKYLRALDAYDTDVKKRGITVAAAVASVVLLLIVLAIAR